MLTFIPAAAIGRAIPETEERTTPGSPFRRWAMIHHPAEPCTRCGRPVVISYRGRNRTKNRVYCTEVCRDAHTLANEARRPRGPAQTPPKPKPCPRPDKLAFDDEAAAAHWFSDLLTIDPGLHTYLCRCGWWHAGHGGPAPELDELDVVLELPTDDAQTIGAIARITHTTPPITTLPRSTP